MTEIRPTYCEEVGESMKAKAATNQPGPCTPVVRPGQTPVPAMKRWRPPASLSPTHRGSPRPWTAQKKGPMGQR